VWVFCNVRGWRIRGGGGRGGEVNTSSVIRKYALYRPRENKYNMILYCPACSLFLKSIYITISSINKFVPQCVLYSNAIFHSLCRVILDQRRTSLTRRGFENIRVVFHFGASARKFNLFFFRFTWKLKD